MCLDSVKETFRNPKDKTVHIGYKAVRNCHGIRKGSQFVKRSGFSSWNNPLTPFGKWLLSRKKDVYPGVTYPCGFHIFKSIRVHRRCKRNGSDWVVVRVRYRKTLAVGMQWGSIIVVAREMLVEKPKPKAKKKVA